MIQPSCLLRDGSLGKCEIPPSLGTVDQGLGYLKHSSTGFTVLRIRSTELGVYIYIQTELSSLTTSDASYIP